MHHREAWGLCPCELDRIVRAEAWRWDRLRDRIYAGAWTIERLSRLRELPSMSDVLRSLTSDDPPPQRKVTPAEAEAFARRMVAAFGGTIIERPKEPAHG